MRSVLHIVAGILMAGVLAACNFNVKESQDVVINNFEDQKQNQALAEALLHYDPRYVARHVDGYDSDSAPGVKIAFFTRASDGQPSMRITYTRNHPVVAERLELLKKSFAEFYLELAKEHMAHQSEFDTLVPLGSDWIKTLFEGDAEALYADVGEQMRAAFPLDQFLNWRTRLLEAMPVLEGVEYQRAQHYGPIDGFPSSNAMYYQLKTSTGLSPTVKVNFTQVEKGWQVTAFGVFMTQS